MNRLFHYLRLTQRFDAWINDWAGSALSLAIRYYVGWQFFKAGLTKIQDWSVTQALFREEYTVPILPPDVAAVMGTAGELGLPVLLALGLITRPAAFGLFCVNAMAVISYPQLFMFDCPAAINDHFYWGALLLVLVAFGGGRVSADEFIRRKPA